MGSASLFFALEPQNAVLSDINTELVNTFIIVRDHPRALFKRFRELAALNQQKRARVD